MPALGVCYYPEHWPESGWMDDARRMREMGLTWVRIGEFAWSRIEPRPGQMKWGWLDRAIDILAGAGLNIIMSTPTATPPRWMIDKYPDMLAVDAAGQPRRFGSRRHYCFSHQGYRKDCVRIAQSLGQRYGANPAVKAWQIDNEYGCHDTVVSYSVAARKAFQTWLLEKYSTIATLNAAWGNIFWSMEYDRFEQIDLPHLTVTEANPAHLMDFRRFSSEQVVRFNRLQADILRDYTDAPLIHNYMGRILDFDHFAVGSDLDIASWDSYPLGFLEDRSDRNENFKRDYYRQGDPDFQAFHHDLYRAVGQMRSKEGRWWVMEQQPGPVNWAPYNPSPLPGMVAVWSWEAMAHGADVVSFFRWRQVPFGQEQMHAGLLRPDGDTAGGGEAATAITKVLSQLPDLTTNPAPVGIVFDYPSAWAWQIQPQGQSFNYFRLVFDIYCGLRRLGLSVDILPSSSESFDERALVFIPGLMAWPDNLRRAIETFQGEIVIGPRSGSKTHDFQIPAALPPDISGLDCQIIAVESLRPDSSIDLVKGGTFKIWNEHVETNAPILEMRADGLPALLGEGGLHYLTGWPDECAMDRILSGLADKIDLATEPMTGGLRCRDWGDCRLYMNYGNKPAAIPGLKETLLGPAGVLLINKGNKNILHMTE